MPVSLRPTLLLDFANSRQLGPLVTFTRASTATRFNRLGLLETVPSGAPRFDFDPVTLACRGLLIEEARTNLCLRSQEFDNASWTKTNVTITADAIAAPDGTLTVDLIEATATTGFHTAEQAITGVIGVSYAISYFVKAGTHPRVRISGRTSANWVALPAGVFDLSAGTVLSSTGDRTATIEPIQPSSGWYRVTVYGTCQTSTNIGVTTSPIPAGQTSNSYDGAAFPGGVYVWGAQMEAGAFPTSYIPTAGSQVTRAADQASITGGNFSSWYSSTQGTLFSEYQPTTTQTNLGVAAFSDGTLNNRMIIRGMTAASFTAFIGSVGGVTQWNDSFLAATTATTKCAFAYKENDIAASRNGAAPITDTSATIPTVNQLVIGADGDQALKLNGHIRRIAYYPARLPSVDLQILTTS